MEKLHLDLVVQVGRPKSLTHFLFLFFGILNSKMNFQSLASNIARLYHLNDMVKDMNDLQSNGEMRKCSRDKITPYSTRTAALSLSQSFHRKEERP